MTRALIIAATLAIALHGAPVAAQGAFCDDRDTMIAALKYRLGQVRYGNRMPNSVGMYELYVNPVSRTWTLVKTQIGGTACIVKNGVGNVPPEANGDPT